MKTLTEQVASVQREIGMRHRVYVRRVEEGLMTRKQADHEVACMEAVLETLRAVKWYTESLYGNSTATDQLNARDRLIRACGQEQGSMF